MAVVDEFSALTILEAFRSITDVLADHADAIDSLDASVGGDGKRSVDMLDGPGQDKDPDYPTPVDDTVGGPSGIDTDVIGIGTDASRTLTAAVGAAGTARDLSTLTSRMSTAAASTAVGPGGAVVALLMRALSELSAAADSVDAERFALTLEVMAELAVAGTTDDQRIRPSGDLSERGDGPAAGSGGTGGAVSVIAAASVGALRAVDQRMSLVEVIIAAADEGLDELESGIATNERLARAGVVDAAGAVFLLVLDSFAAIAAGDPLPEPPVEDVVGSPVVDTVFRIACVAVPLDPSTGERAHGQWLETCAWLETKLAQLGAVTRFRIASTSCDVEVLTNDAGRTIESLCTVARPTELSILLDGRSDQIDGPSVGSGTGARSS